MIWAYVNYPHAHAAFHTSSTCAEIQKHGKLNQRVVELNVGTATGEFQKLSNGSYPFESDASLNDMWLKVDFGDEAFEEAVVRYAVHLLATRYTRFDGLDPIRHDCL